MCRVSLRHARLGYRIRRAAALDRPLQVPD
jgi:hypothetical protein